MSKKAIVEKSIIIFAAAVLFAGLAAPAHGAPSKFILDSCDAATPLGDTPTVVFDQPPVSTLRPFVECNHPGGSIGIQGTGHVPGGTDFGITVDVPATPGGFVESGILQAGTAALTAANNYTWVAEPGWPMSNSGESERNFFIRHQPEKTSTGNFSIHWNCDGGVAPSGCEAGPIVWVRNIATTEVDPNPPTLSPPQGSLLGTGVLRGHQSIAVEATDEGGGLSKIELLINGAPAGQPTKGSCKTMAVRNMSYEGTVAEVASPCPSKLAARWEVDTAEAPFHEGANSVQVCASDFSTLSEANKTCSPISTVAIDNSCAESPVAGGEAISAQFVRSHREDVTVPYDTAAKVTGEVSDSAGDPIPGATVCVQSQVQGAPLGPRPVATTVTDAHGRFIYRVPPGPNRKVLLGYRHDSFQVAKTINYYAHSMPTITIRPQRVPINGEVRISGKLPGVRAIGRVVVLQVSALRSNRWFTFRRATTNHQGVFHTRYRFEATTRTITYRMRAVVPRQHGYPWEIGHSKPSRVRVFKEAPSRHSPRARRNDERLEFVTPTGHGDRSWSCGARDRHGRAHPLGDGVRRRCASKNHREERRHRSGSRYREEPRERGGPSQRPGERSR